MAERLVAAFVPQFTCDRISLPCSAGDSKTHLNRFFDRLCRLRGGVGVSWLLIFTARDGDESGEIMARSFSLTALPIAVSGSPDRCTSIDGPCSQDFMQIGENIVSMYDGRSVVFRIGRGVRVKRKTN